MSIKAQTFASVITNPMNTHNFEVVIPGVDPNITLIVESTTFPAQGQYRDISLYFQGEKITYQGLPENGGTWAIKIPDSDTGVVRKELDRLSKASYDQRTGIMKPTPWTDIQVYAKDLEGNIVNKIVLHGAWIKQRQQVNLSAEAAGTSWKWDYVFYYNWVED